MSIIRNKDTIIRYHNCKSLSDSLTALDYAFKYSDPERLVGESINIASNLEYTNSTYLIGHLLLLLVSAKLPRKC